MDPVIGTAWPYELVNLSFLLQSILQISLNLNPTCRKGPRRSTACSAFAAKTSTAGGMGGGAKPGGALARITPGMPAAGFPLTGAAGTGTGSVAGGFAGGAAVGGTTVADGLGSTT